MSIVEEDFVGWVNDADIVANPDPKTYSILLALTLTLILTLTLLTPLILEYYV